MKRDHRNPPGDKPDVRAKGSERFQARGKGDLKQYTGHSGMGSLGASKGGDVRSYGHANQSFSGSTVTGSSKACK